MEKRTLVNKKYVSLLRNQIKQCGEWLIDNCDELVSKVVGITDFKILIDLENGAKIPTVEVCQKNTFFNYQDYIIEEEKNNVRNGNEDKSTI